MSCNCKASPHRGGHIKALKTIQKPKAPEPKPEEKKDGETTETSSK